MPHSEQDRWFAEEVQPHEGSLRSWLRGIQHLNNITVNGVKRVYLNEPRSYRLTTSVDF